MQELSLDTASNVLFSDTDNGGFERVAQDIWTEPQSADPINEQEEPRFAVPTQVDNGYSTPFGPNQYYAHPWLDDGVDRYYHPPFGPSTVYSQPIDRSLSAPCLKTHPQTSELTLDLECIDPR